MDIWKRDEFSNSWSMSVLCQVHKKEDKLNPKNYREILLLNTSYKVLSNLLLKPFIKKIIGEYQTGFMVGKSSIDQIHMTKQLAEKAINSIRMYLCNL